MLYKTSFIEDSEDNEKKKMARVEILDTSSNVVSILTSALLNK